MMTAFSRAIQVFSRSSSARERSPIAKAITTGVATPMLAIRMKTIHAIVSSAGRDARPRDRRRAGDGQQQVLGIEPRQEHAGADRLHGREPLERPHPLGRRRLLVALRAAAPLARGDEQHEDAEDQLEPAHPRRRGAVAGRAGAARKRQHEHPDDRQADPPADDERRAVHAPVRRHQHQHDRDDRQRAHRHADGCRQHLPDRLSHATSPLSAGGYSRASIAAASRSRSMYGSPLTSTATRLMVPPVNSCGWGPG